MTKGINLTAELTQMDFESRPRDFTTPYLRASAARRATAKRRRIHLRFVFLLRSRSFVACRAVGLAEADPFAVNSFIPQLKSPLTPQNET